MEQNYNEKQESAVIFPASELIDILAAIFNTSFIQQLGPSKSPALGLRREQSKSPSLTSFRCQGGWGRGREYKQKIQFR